MINVVVLFLLFILVLGMMGKLRLLKPGGRKPRSRLPRPRKCGDCGRLLIAPGACGCRGKR